MKYLFVFVLFIFLQPLSFADELSSLALSDAEMQKLKKYFPADDTDHLSWKGDPITIMLPIGNEKRIVFTDRVSVDIKETLNSDQLRVLNNDKSLYLTALKPFPKSRIFITTKETGTVLLVDLVTSPEATNATQYIDIENKLTTHNTAAQVFDNKLSINDTHITYVDLIRFAWQQSYAPERLLTESPLYVRAAMHTQKFVSRLVYGDKVIAFPLGSWISGRYYITAIALRNKYSHITHINLQHDLCGQWQAATLYPRSILQPYGNKNKDTTMLFLISNKPFGDTIGVCYGHA